MAGVKFDFAGASVLVTGGTRGIGLAIAESFADAGADVTVTGTRPSAEGYETDLRRFSYTELTGPDGVGSVAAGLDRLDVLVNNAGANLPGGQDEWEPDVFDEALALNLSMAFRLCVACRPLLEQSRCEGGAAVVNLASMASYFAVPMVPGYGAAKAGVVQMTKNLGVAWASDGIRVNAMAPGLIHTDMTAPMMNVEELSGPQMRRTPLGRFGTPADVAPTVLYLACPAARFVTGQTWNVDGGYSAS